jgi:hypothetical protein
MAGLIRRFTTYPTLDVILSVPGVVIIDLIPPGVFAGRTTGKVLLIGEWPKGPLVTPTDVEGDQTIQSVFGGFSLSMRDPLSPATNPYSNGCAFAWLKDKAFRSLALIRVDMTLAEGVKITLGGTPTPLTADVTVPAGTRVRDASAPTVEFALAQDVVFAAGTDLAVVAFTAFDTANLAATYSTRTVSGIPVYSVRGVSETLVGDVDSVDTTDLFRAGIGPGTALPSLTVAASTGAVDGAAANAAALTVLTSGAIDTRYTNALDASLPGGLVTSNVYVIASARQSNAIRTALLANAAAASAVGNGRRAVTRPPIGTLPASAISSVAPGVGVTRGDRNFYCYPHARQLLPEIAALDPSEVISSPRILVGADAWMASLLSILPPENNPGQSTQDVVSGGLLLPILELESGLTTAGQPTAFTATNYEQFQASGVCALYRSPQLSEWVFMSGVTSVDPSLYPSLTRISRRDMADFIQDSLAAVNLPYSKKPTTNDRYDSLVAEMDDFLAGLLSEDNPAAQRISAYSLDSKSGNTLSLQGSGIRVVLISVQTLDELDDIVLQTNIGPTVVISEVEVSGIL